MDERPGLRDRILGCLLGGAIGDAYGGIAERGRVCLSDDTQLTLATCESIAEAGRADPAHLAATFRRWFEGRRLTGLGSSTLKALRDLEAGAHWALAGARGEMAAGNGGAMRIAPLAFAPGVDRMVIRDVVRITHHSDEAYIGALVVVEAIRGDRPRSLFEQLRVVAEPLPDSRVRDRMMSVVGTSTVAGLRAVAALGTSGYVVDTVPLALVAAWAMESSFAQTLEELTQLGGDVDTIGSIAGQIAGAALGVAGLPSQLLDGLPEREMVESIAERFVARVIT